MSRTPQRGPRPAADFEWFEFNGNPTDDEQAAALQAIARCIDEDAAGSSAPAWSGLVAPVSAWLKRPTPYKRP